MIRPASAFTPATSVVVIAIVSVALIAMAPVERPKYRILPLEPLDETHVMGAAPEAINGNNVVARTTESPVSRHATRWDPADGAVPVPLDFHAFPRNRALAINDGLLVGGYSYYIWDMWVAALWTPDGACIPLGGLWEIWVGLSEVRGVNNAGVAVGVSSDDESPARAFRWTAETGMVDIGTLGGPFAVAQAINEQGQIVGHAANESFDIRAYLWEDDQITQLNVLPDGNSCEALDINDLGQVVGTSGAPPTGDWLHAVLWETQSNDILEPIDLDVPIAGGQAWAAAINNHGDIVGNALDPDGPSDWTEPWIWKDGQMKLLQNLIPPDTGWDLYQVRDINDAGWIVGVSYMTGTGGYILIPLHDGDLDYDGDVDGGDFALLAACVDGPDVEFLDGCLSADIDEDGDCDLLDVGRFQQTFGAS